MQNKYKVIATKVDWNIYLQLKFIADRTGLKVYNLLQTVADAYIKYLSTDTYITESIRTIVNAFARFRFQKDTFTLIEPNDSKFHFTKCIAFIGKHGKRYEQAVLLRVPEKDEQDIIMNRNNDEMLESLLQTIDPNLVASLLTIKQSNSLISLTDTLRYVIDAATPGMTDSIAEDVAELFSDNRRSEYGSEIDYSQVGQYKQKKHFTIA